MARDEPAEDRTADGEAERRPGRAPTTLTHPRPTAGADDPAEPPSSGGPIDLTDGAVPTPPAATDDRPAHADGPRPDDAGASASPGADAADREPARSLEALLARQSAPASSGRRSRLPGLLVAGRDRLGAIPVKQLVGGVALCLVGIGLLAGWVLHVSWTPLIDLAVVGVGVLLVVQGYRGVPARPLIVLGVVLALLSVCTWRAGTSFDGGFGRRTVRPPALRSATYQLGTGVLTIDLRGAAVPAGTFVVRARVGVGRIVVRVAKVQPVIAHLVAGSGMTSAFGKHHAGPGVDDVRHTADLTGRPPLRLDLRVGIGSVEVRGG